MDLQVKILYYNQKYSRLFLIPEQFQLDTIKLKYLCSKLMITK